jgi:hypothetical protein
MKDRGKGPRAHDEPLWLRRAVPVLPAVVLMMVGAGCHEPQADISSTAAGLRTVVTKQVEAPAPRPLGVLTVDRAISEALAASPQLDQMANRVAAAPEPTTPSTP